MTKTLQWCAPEPQQAGCQHIEPGPSGCIHDNYVICYCMVTGSSSRTFYSIIHPFSQALVLINVTGDCLSANHKTTYKQTLTQLRNSESYT